MVKSEYARCTVHKQAIAMLSQKQYTSLYGVVRCFFISQRHQNKNVVRFVVRFARGLNYYNVNNSEQSNKIKVGFCE